MSKAGSARFRGSLADGTKFKYGNRLTKSNALPFHILTDQKNGSVTGTIAFRNRAGSDLDATDLIWFKPDTSGDRRPARTYPNGFPGGIFVDVLGSAFELARREAIFASFPPPDQDGNARAKFTDGGLAAEGITVAVNVTPQNEVAAIPPAPRRFKLKINEKTGGFSGEFIHPDSFYRVNLGAVVLQKAQCAGGFFINEEQSGAFELVPDGP